MLADHWQWKLEISFKTYKNHAIYFRTRFRPGFLPSIGMFFLTMIKDGDIGVLGCTSAAPHVCLICSVAAEWCGRSEQQRCRRLES
jgi:hypothetical protein